MGKDLYNTSVDFLDTLSNIMDEKFDNKDQIEVCQIISELKADNTYDIQLERNTGPVIIHNIINASKYIFHIGDYAYILKVKNQLRNAFLISSLSGDTPVATGNGTGGGNIINNTYVTSGGGGGTTVIPNPTITGEESNLKSIQIDNQKFKMSTTYLAENEEDLPQGQLVDGDVWYEEI